MKTIALAHYRHKDSKEGEFFDTYSEWNKLAREAGVKFEDSVIDPDAADSSSKAYARANWLVHNSPALIIRSELSFLSDMKLNEVVHQRLREGLRVLVLAPPKSETQRPE